MSPLRASENLAGCRLGGIALTSASSAAGAPRYSILEGCRSGRTGRSRKPLYPLRGTVGSNPTPSATLWRNDMFLRYLLMHPVISPTLNPTLLFHLLRGIASHPEADGIGLRSRKKPQSATDRSSPTVVNVTAAHHRLCWPRPSAGHRSPVLAKPASARGRLPTSARNDSPVARRSAGPSRSAARRASA